MNKRNEIIELSYDPTQMSEIQAHSINCTKLDSKLHEL
jgi:hypothetical protein